LREAGELMRGTLLPEADRLVEANTRAVDHAYSARSGEARALGRWALVLGIAGLLVLIAGQVRLSTQTRRVFNPALVAATALVVVLVSVGTSTASSSVERLRVAKEDSFDSVLALTRAGAIAKNANGDESRFLVDRARSADAERAFADKSRQLADFGIPFEGYDRAVADAAADVRGYASGVEPPFGGQFGREFRNITFVGERAAAEDALHWYAVYEQYDRRMRTMVARGEVRAAIDFNTSYRENNSNWAFDRLVRALANVTAINQAHLDSATNAGLAGLRGRDVAAALATLVAIALMYAGIRPRLAEYRAGQSLDDRGRRSRPGPSAGKGTSGRGPRTTDQTPSTPAPISPQTPAAGAVPVGGPG
jgi:hypothetical protein